MKNPCPLCQKPLTVFYSMKRMEIVCQCDNAKCAMFPIETTADRQQDAIDRFHGEALKVESRAEKKARTQQEMTAV